MVVAGANSYQQNDPALIEWAGGIALDRIPGLLLFLTARWLAETGAKINEPNDSPHSIENLVTAGGLAQHLNLPESWVRNEERLGRIPSVRVGKYVRFRLSEVERTLAQKLRRSQ